MPEEPNAHLAALTDLVTPFAVRVAATLRLADRIDAGATTPTELAAATGTDPDALGRLLRHLVGVGVLAEPEPGVFGLNDTGRLLRDDGPAGQRYWLDLDGLGARLDLACTGLLHSVRTGAAGYPVVHGRGFWEDLDGDAGRRRGLDETMLALQRHTAPQVATRYDWSAAKTVVDVGGGHGGLLAELLARHDHLRGVVLDRGGAAEAARRTLAGRGVADRAEVVAGSFFDPLPPDADVYLVSRALSDWPDAEARAILRRCAEAAGPAGHVLVVEVLPAPPDRTGFDLRMLVTVGGRARTAEELGRLAATAGLRVAATVAGEDGLLLLDLVGDAR